MLKKSIQVFVFFLIGIVSSNFACSQTDAENHERWYQVEILIFSRADTSHVEYWPNDIKLAYPTNLTRIQSGEGDSAIIPASVGLLSTQASGIAKNPAYTTLYHQAWRQKIVARKTNLLISAGKTVNGHQELEGSIALSVGQYLKLQTNLWFTQFSPAGTSVNETWPALPTLGGQKEELPKTTDAVITRIVKINESRSMRSNEVHYLDHPLIGIFVKIIPSN